MSSSQEFDIGPTPKFVDGGCLCGALRYRVTFSPVHDFPSSSMICQCTQCRKGTSCLFFVAHRVEPASAFAWIQPPTTLKDFQASPQANRGFCSACGSWIYWKRADKDRISFAVGTVDALYLFGEGADGVAIPKDGFGKALASGLGLCEFTGNEIKGVTDDMPFLLRGRRSVGEDAADI